ncbi:chromosome partitioning protein ParA [Vibrio spartinae]|uniref:Uncharacterized protein n=1 Tax=Vibrio spartinae TaxID=1918945 RepID=A0A1N6M5N5_9VIBR|nr:chromosome partitioning protein ParA [Vibrio spartinae]SIO94656.1 hypothetical protein VSP9026_02385 [Vibrio spartinae]
MESNTSDRGISRGEFAAFRNEMRECMQQQTELMRQMVQLQAKHHNLESLVSRHDKEIESLEKRVLPIEQNQGGTNVKTQYNRDLIWAILGLIFALAGYAIRGS